MLKQPNYKNFKLTFDLKENIIVKDKFYFYISKENIRKKILGSYCQFLKIYWFLCFDNRCPIPFS